MRYLARKISKAKWETTSYKGQEDIRADAITGPCLRTYGDALSLWQCKQDRTDLAKVVLALVTRTKKPIELIDKVHLVLIHESEFENDIFTLETTPENADTDIQDLQARHFDLLNLTMTTVCLLAKKIATKVRQDSQFHMFTRSQVREIICDAVKQKRLDINTLEDKVREEIQKKLRLPPPLQ